MLADMARPRGYVVEGATDLLARLRVDLVLEGLEDEDLIGHVVQEEALHDVLRHVIGPLRVEGCEARPRHFGPFLEALRQLLWLLNAFNWGGRLAGPVKK